MDKFNTHIFPIEQAIDVSVSYAVMSEAIFTLAAVFFVIPWLFGRFIFFAISVGLLHLRYLIFDCKNYLYCHQRYELAEDGDKVSIAFYPRLFFGRQKPKTWVNYLFDPLGSLFYWFNSKNYKAPWYSKELLCKSLDKSTTAGVQGVVIYSNIFSMSITVDFYWRESIGSTLGEWEYKSIKLDKNSKNTDIPFCDHYRLRLK